MATSYTYATLADAIASVRSRLYNTSASVNQQFWTDAEITVYIQESLRTWNALTGFWRDEFTFNLTPNFWWYDLTSVANSLRRFTVTDVSVIELLEYHLLEPLTSSTPLTWTGSDQFNIAELLYALTRAQNETLAASGCTVSRDLVAAPSGPGRIFLSDETLDILRVVWFPASTYSKKTLRQADIFAKRAFERGYTVAAQGPPGNWMQNSEPPPSFDVDREPPVVGQYEVMVVNCGATFDIDNNVGFAIPNDWTWVPKWGALGYLLSREAHAKDSLRAMYASQRFEEGKGLLYQAPAVLGVWLDGIPMAVDAVTNGDNFNRTWQSAPSGKPRSCYTMGLNQLAFGPAPDIAYAPTVSVVENAPIPTSAGDYIQISRDLYQTIIGYAQHLAMFKSGGAEFLSTVPEYQNLLRKAALYNSKLNEMGFFSEQMAELSQLQQEFDPTYSSPTPAEVK